MLNEEVAKYRELSGDTNPNTPISRIGGYLDGYEKALEQESILDKIRAEIEAEIKGCETAIDMYKEKPDIVLCYKTFIQSYTKTLQIIDKYRDKEQKDNGFFDEIMDDSEDGEVYEKIKEIIAKAKEQEE